MPSKKTARPSSCPTNENISSQLLLFFVRNPAANNELFLTRLQKILCTGWPQSRRPLRVSEHCVLYILWTVQCLHSNKIPGCWSNPALILIPKKGSSKFHPIACNSVVLDAVKNSIFPQFASFLNASNPQTLAYRLPRYFLGCSFTLIHNISFVLDNKSEAFRICFLAYIFRLFLIKPTRASCSHCTPRQM